MRLHLIAFACLLLFGDKLFAQEVSFKLIDEEPSFAVVDQPVSFKTIDAAKRCTCGKTCGCPDGENCGCTKATPAKKRILPKFYTRPDCVMCPAAKKFLDEIEVAYEEIEDPDGDVPRVEWDGITVVGLRKDWLRALLGRPEAVKTQPVVLQTVSTYGPPAQACTTCRGR